MGHPRAARRRARPASTPLTRTRGARSYRTMTARTAYASPSDDSPGMNSTAPPSEMEMDSPEMNGVQNNAIDGTGRVSGVPSYADWWTRADAVAAARVAAEKDYDEDEYELAQAMRSLSPADAASPWWEVIELAATFGAAGGGIAAVLMQEAAVATLVAALPLVAAGARRRKDNVRSRVAAERLMELREETRAMARKAQRDATLESTATRAANAVVPRVSDVVQGAVSGVRNEIRSDLNDVAIKSVALEERMKALEAAVAEQTSSARASAREAGSVAGMLARDVAAARVDAREGIQSLAVELRKATAVADDAKGEVMKELNTLWQLMESIESEADGVKLTTDGSGTTLAALMEEVRAAGAAAMAAKIAAEESLNASDRAPSAERLESVRDAVKEALDEAKEVSVSGAPLDETKLAAALENVVSKLKTADELQSESRSISPPGGVAGVTGVTVTAKLDAEQWSLLGERLTQLEEASKDAAAEAAQYAGKAVGRIRAGLREDLVGVSETLATIATQAATANVAAERAATSAAGVNGAVADGLARIEAASSSFEPSSFGVDSSGTTTRTMTFFRLPTSTAWTSRRSVSTHPRQPRSTLSRTHSVAAAAIPCSRPPRRARRCSSDATRRRGRRRR